MPALFGVDAIDETSCTFGGVAKPPAALPEVRWDHQAGGELAARPPAGPAPLTAG